MRFALILLMVLMISSCATRITPYEFPRREILTVYGKRDKNIVKITRSYNRSIKKGYKFEERYSKRHNKKIK